MHLLYIFAGPTCDLFSSYWDPLPPSYISIITLPSFISVCKPQAPVGFLPPQHSSAPSYLLLLSGLGLSRGWISTLGLLQRLFLCLSLQSLCIHSKGVIQEPDEVGITPTPTSQLMPPRLPEVNWGYTLVVTSPPPH